jgi:hypothetical protein
LEWGAQWVKPRDFTQFDYALINGTDYLHKFFESVPALKPLTTDGRWRLYQCLKDTASPN